MTSRRELVWPVVVTAWANALARRLTTAPATMVGLEEWRKELQETTNLEALVRAALSVLHVLTSRLESQTPWAAKHWRPAIKTAEDWVLCPCRAHAERARLIGEEAVAHADAAMEESPQVGDWWSGNFVDELFELPRAIGRLVDSEFERSQREVLDLCRSLLVRCVGETPLSRAELCSCIASELSEWRLGRDPIRRRREGTVA